LVFIRFIANSFYEYGKGMMVAFTNDFGTKSLVEAEVFAPGNFSENLIAKPLFAVATPGNYEDFKLLTESPQINKGAFLTVIVEAGNGKSLMVEDALYFRDGFGLIEGDRIQLERQTFVATVLNVFDSNTSTLDHELKWTNGHGVGFEYKDSRLDIWAHEFGKTYLY